jgi:hypothetical protein
MLLLHPFASALFRPAVEFLTKLLRLPGWIEGVVSQFSNLCIRSHQQWKAFLFAI